MGDWSRNEKLEAELEKTRTLLANMTDKYHSAERELDGLVSALLEVLEPYLPDREY